VDNDLNRNMNLDGIKNIYIIGIEGAGTSALACILKAQGKNVVGSDEGDHFYYDVLVKADIKVFHKFTAENLKNAFRKTKSKPVGVEKIDLVIYSTVVQPETNPELQYALEAEEHFKIMSYPQALGAVFNEAEFGIAVCGTHGKTTTTAMLATALEKVGIQPTALVGSKVLEWGSNTLVGTGKYFVVEADEYQNKLQYYKPRAVILTSADYDHPDFFQTEKDYLQVFKDFVARIPEAGFLVAYAGDKNVVEISKSARCEVIFYDEIGAQEILLNNDFCSDKECRGKTFGCCPAIYQAKEKIKLFGVHNLLNATATFKVIQKLGLNEQVAKRALQEFSGTARRFEIKGEYQGAVIIDDYAHHPVEVQATLQSAREKYGDKKIKCIFHPHTFTRTEVLLTDFAKSFAKADEIYLLDIFGSAREKQGEVSSDDLIREIKIRNKNKVVKNLHTIEEAVEYFKTNLTDGDILITMGAGDVYRVGGKLL
jgi:UDP-N-acetylmuramate--alanine ligase